MQDSIYKEKILDHYRYPHNFGVLKKPTHRAGHQNISCGDALQFQARVEKGKITDIAFTGNGCAISMASASLLSEYLKNKSLTTIKKFSKKDIEKLLGIQISHAREKCAMLGVETLKQLKKI